MKKRKMKIGEAFVGMKRRGSQLRRQNMVVFWKPGRSGWVVDADYAIIRKEAFVKSSDVGFCRAN